MDKTLEIVKVIDGKYEFIQENLKSSLSSAQDCDYISLISILGPECDEKTFFTKCLFNYIYSENKNEWTYSEDIIVNKYDLFNYKNDQKSSVVKITSNAFIIPEELDNTIAKTAVFLMYFNSDLTLDVHSQIVQDIIGLFLLTSSTVIYNRKMYLPVIYLKI
jgi:hypothetical protein